MNLVNIARFVEVEPGSEFLESQEMGVEPAPSDLIAAGLGHDSLAETCEQRSDHEHRTAQGGAFPDELITFQIRQVHLVGLERVVVARQPFHLYVDVSEQLDEIVHIKDVGNVVNGDGLTGEQCGANHL